MFGKFQDLLKGCLLRLNTNITNNTNKSTNVKHMSTKDFHNVRVEQLNLIENEFKDKVERIKVMLYVDTKFLLSVTFKIQTFLILFRMLPKHFMKNQERSYLLKT